jgi:putative hydrolase of the HAD superfamily
LGTAPQEKRDIKANRRKVGQSPHSTSAGSTIKVVIFDLDGTLYQSSVIGAKFAEAAYHAIAKLKNISVHEAQQVVEHRRTQMRSTYGDPVPYTLTLKSIGMSTEHWHEENIAYFDPRDYLRHDEQLMNSLSVLSRRYRLAVLTNNNSVQTDRTLEALGVKHLFEKVYTYNTFKLLKPDTEFVRRAIDDMGVRPEECCFVGDRYNVDLEPARRLHMHICEVKGPSDIYALARDFRCD